MSILNFGFLRTGASEDLAHSASARAEDPPIAVRRLRRLLEASGTGDQGPSAQDEKPRRSEGEPGDSIPPEGAAIPSSDAARLLAAAEATTATQDVVTLEHRLKVALRQAQGERQARQAAEAALTRATSEYEQRLALLEARLKAQAEAVPRAAPVESRRSNRGARQRLRRKRAKKQVDR